MRKIKFILGVIIIVMVVFAISWVLTNDLAVVTQPKGFIAQQELKLIQINYLLMSIIVIPTLAALFFVAWKFREGNKKASYEPNSSHKPVFEILLWIIPSSIVACMAIILWHTAHELDPYQPIKSDVQPLHIQVVSLDWKWLFIYPEQEIATINYLQIPEKTPIHFSLTADGSPMNSFWIPQLSGQIYSMAGMTSTIHMIADHPGIFTGKAAELNGEGFAHMTFLVKAVSPCDFENWIREVNETAPPLTTDTYNELIKPSTLPVMLYSHVEEGLFGKIITKYTQHQ